jgi:hypothetical protein
VDLAHLKPSETHTVFNKVLPLYGEETAAKASKILFGIQSEKLPPNETFWEVAAEVFNIALGIYAAPLLESPEDLMDPLKQPGILSKVRDAFGLSEGIVDLRGGNFVVNHTLLMNLIIEQMARAEVRKSA